MSPTAAVLADTAFLVALGAYVVALVLVATRRHGTARTVVAVGAGVHAVSLVARGVAGGHLPWSNMYEFSTAVTLVAVVAVLWATRERPDPPVVAGTLGVVVVTMGAALALAVPATPLVPALDTYWLAVHTSAAVVASAVLTVGAAATGVALWRDRPAPGDDTVPAGRSAARAGRRGGRGGARDVGADRFATGAIARPGRAGTLTASSPSATAVAVEGGRAGSATAQLAWRITTAGFLVWTFAVVSGAVWAEQAWGRYWGWDPKETAAFVTWVLYAAALHARATPGWRGRRAAWLSLAGFVALLVTYYVVNLVVVGLHSYA